MDHLDAARGRGRGAGCRTLTSFVDEIKRAFLKEGFQGWYAYFLASHRYEAVREKLTRLPPATRGRRSGADQVVCSWCPAFPTYVHARQQRGSLTIFTESLVARGALLLGFDVWAGG